MTLKEFKETHIKLYHAQAKEGNRNRLILLPVLCLGLFFGYLYIDGLNRNRLKNELSQIQIDIIGFSTVVVSLIIFFSTDPHSFLFPTKNISAKIKYKKDIYNLISHTHPEIQYFNPGKKISPIDFYNSHIFNSRFEDYNGDDWMIVTTNNSTFNMCELHVTKLFKTVFRGLFITYKTCNVEREFLINFGENTLKQKVSVNFSEATLKNIESYCKTTGLSIRIAQHSGTIYIAIERLKNILERDSIKSLETIDDQLEIFKNNLQIVENAINDLK